MNRLEEFYDWLEDQDYWVNVVKMREEFPEISFSNTTGVTFKRNEDGDKLVPRRDLRALVKPPEDADENNATR